METLTKICTKCEETLPIGMFYKNRISLRKWCIPCCRKYNNLKRQRHGVIPLYKNEIKKMGALTKVCTKCGEEKALDNFGKRSNKYRYSYRCKKCACLYAKEYRKKHPEIDKTYYKKNKERLNKQTREYAKKDDYGRRYYKKNKEKLQIYHKQRAKKEKENITILYIAKYLHCTMKEVRNLPNAFIDCTRLRILIHREFKNQKVS